MSDLSALTDPELLKLWNNEGLNSEGADIDDIENLFERRDKILEALKERGLFPANFMKQWENDTGAYPTIDDPEFLQKLLAKREFAESLQTTWKPENDPCGDTNAFEVTPVQRFAANLMSPRTPYMSALLFHGVGVGKTCAAVQIAEAWLDTYPRDKIFLVAPPTIQEGFYRTIFDISKLKLGTNPTDPNKISGCTGDSYLELTGMTYERDAKRIDRRVRQAIKRRYDVFGYLSFAYYVNDLLSTVDRDLDEDEQERQERAIINKKFSGKLLIIDEAHNVRDITGDKDDDETPGGDAAKSDMAAGKQMTVPLRKVLQYAQGLKLVLLTATPMYNSYKEIIFMLNLLLMNDKKATITDREIFRSDGSIRSKGMETLGYIASRYVSYMRGENPKSFPIRLDPENTTLLREIDYPTKNPRGGSIPEDEIVFQEHLPVVPIELEGDALEASLELTRALPAGDQGISGIELAGIIQAGNFIPPSADDGDFADRLAPDALDNLFDVKSKGGELVYKSNTKLGAEWLARDELANYSPKFAFLLDQLRKARGVCFAYMRVVNLGALPLALALEANGYTPVGRSTGLLGDGIQAPGGRQCALCKYKEEEHPTTGHAFTPAYYGLLTGNIKLSPNNKLIIETERRRGNEEGGIMKVIIGSQIAGEGVDLRYVREVHMLDSWYHLNRTEQVIGRAIRFCSHSALPPEKRNATIYLYSAVFPEDRSSRETADLYSYRVAFRKAVQVGNVTRALKIRAIDCNLNHDAIIIAGQDSVTQIDSKGKERSDVDINDKPFTAICDWNDSCMYECAPKIKVDALTADDSTYSEFAAKWRESALKKRFRDLFKDQVFYGSKELWNDVFGDIPIAARSELFSNVINNKTFQVTHNGVQGYITQCNGYYVFQPNVYMDLHIPMAIRAAAFPVRRDHFEPIKLEPYEVSVEESKSEKAQFSLDEQWNGIVEWITEIRDSEQGEGEYTPVTIPESVYERIRILVNGEEEVQKKYTYIVEMIQWFHESVLISGGDLKSFYRTVLEYIWDTWFTLEEQIELVTSGNESAYRRVKETEYVAGSTTVLRFYNSENASIVYMCNQKGIWNRCPSSIENNVKRSEKGIQDVFRDREEPYKTGEFYGVLTSHNGDIVFKTNDAQVKGSKSKLGGVMCAVVSGIQSKYDKLIRIGQLLEKAELPDLELKGDVIKRGGRQVENSVRGCALLELALRYADHIKLNNRRWFFRPVFGKLIGYSGYFKKTKGNITAISIKRKVVKEDEKDSEEEETSEESPTPKTTLLRRAKK
jgi:Helicase conserved C-terminal domain/Type III restriction enzyme, res subunit